MRAWKFDMTPTPCTNARLQTEYKHLKAFSAHVKSDSPSLNHCFHMLLTIFGEIQEKTIENAAKMRKCTDDMSHFRNAIKMELESYEAKHKSE